MAAELDFQAIIDLVGDKLREVFRIGDIGIRWYDPKTDSMHFPYLYERGKRISASPKSASASPMWLKFAVTRQPVIANSHQEQDALGMGTVPGTARAMSVLMVPILGGDQVLGMISLEDHER